LSLIERSSERSEIPPVPVRLPATSQRFSAGSGRFRFRRVVSAGESLHFSGVPVSMAPMLLPY
jgi:hypothetical protein